MHYEHKDFNQSNSLWALCLLRELCGKLLFGQPCWLNLHFDYIALFTNGSII
jgi:hypothetical protein